MFNVGSGPNHTMSLLEFLNLLEEQTGERTDISFDDWREGDQKVYVSDSSRAREQLDWAPQVDFETNIERFLKWDASR